MRNIFGFIAAIIVSLNTSSAYAANKHLPFFAGKYTVAVAPVGSDPATNIVYTTPSDNLKQLISISKTGVLTGKWGRMYTTNELMNNISDNADDGLGTSESQYDVTLKGKISKITVSGKNVIATYTFTLSDGGKGSGAIKMMITGGTKYIPLKRYFSMNGKIRVAGQSGALTAFK